MYVFCLTIHRWREKDSQGEGARTNHRASARGLVSSNYSGCQSVKRRFRVKLYEVSKVNDRVRIRVYLHVQFVHVGKRELR